jgi:Immunity protein 35
MLDRATAIKKVTELINADFKVEGDELTIIPEETLEKDYGWVFFYNSSRYLRTGKFSDRVVGNGPIVFEKESGSIHMLGSHRDPKDLIRDYEVGRVNKGK